MKSADGTAKLHPIAGFAISGYRTLHDVRVRAPGPVTVLCGPNNVGKSSLLAALGLYPKLAAAVQGKTPRDEVLADGTTAEIGLDLGGPAMREHLLGVGRESFTDLAERFGTDLPDLLWVPLRPSKRGVQIDVELALAPLQSALQGMRNVQSSPLRQALLKAFEVTTLDLRWLQAAAAVLLPQVTYTFIADVRRQADQPLGVGDLATLARANARNTGRPERIGRWADQLELILRDVFGDDVRYEVWPTDEGGDFRLRIDGEDNRELGEVGAGVREVVAIAYAALQDPGATVLAIEEPENCLHPIAVKRLIESLPRRADVQLFVSTHSSAVINANPDAVVHLSRTGTQTTSRQVDAAVDRYDAVRSLGYSPADLVLAPCAVWVEGPSDRLYLNAWLSTHGLIEGIDYQIMFFGGSLASHVTTKAATVPLEALAAIRNLGRHCAVIVDSDRDTPHARHKKHVIRFREELDDDPHAHLLITHGREIENYIPLTIINNIRQQHGVHAIKTDQRLTRMIDPPLRRKMSKVAFAEHAISQLDGSVPELARSDIAALATFIGRATLN